MPVTTCPTCGAHDWRDLTCGNCGYVLTDEDYLAFLAWLDDRGLSDQYDRMPDSAEDY